MRPVYLDRIGQAFRRTAGTLDGGLNAASYAVDLGWIAYYLSSTIRFSQRQLPHYDFIRVADPGLFLEKSNWRYWRKQGVCFLLPYLFPLLPHPLASLPPSSPSYSLTSYPSLPHPFSPFFLLLLFAFSCQGESGVWPQKIFDITDTRIRVWQLTRDPHNKMTQL